MKKKFQIHSKTAKFILLYVGPKSSVASTHFIQGLKSMPRRKKRLRMSKKSPSCQEISPRTILSLAN